MQRVSGDDFIYQLYGYASCNKALLADGSKPLNLTPSSMRLLNELRGQLVNERHMHGHRSKPPRLTPRLQTVEKLVPLLCNLVHLRLRNTAADAKRNLVLDLSLLPGLRVLEINNCRSHTLIGLSALRRQLERLVVIDCVSSMRELLHGCLGDLLGRSGQWPALKNVSLSFNGLTELDDSLRMLERAETIDLSNNSIRSLDHFQDCTQLKFVSLAHNCIGVLRPLHTVFGNISTLILRHNRITSCAAFAKLYCLEKLDLSHNLLSSLSSILPLSNNHCLTEVWFEGNPVALDQHYFDSILVILNERLVNERTMLMVDGKAPTRSQVRRVLQLAKQEWRGILQPESCWADDADRGELPSLPSPTASTLSAPYPGSPSSPNKIVGSSPSPHKTSSPQKRKKVRLRLASIQNMGDLEAELRDAAAKEGEEVGEEEDADHRASRAGPNAVNGGSEQSNGLPQAAAHGDTRSDTGQGAVIGAAGMEVRGGQPRAQALQELARSRQPDDFLQLARSLYTSGGEMWLSSLMEYQKLSPVTPTVATTTTTATTTIPLNTTPTATTTNAVHPTTTPPTNTSHRITDHGTTGSASAIREQNTAPDDGEVSFECLVHKILRQGERERRILCVERCVIKECELATGRVLGELQTSFVSVDVYQENLTLTFSTTMGDEDDGNGVGGDAGVSLSYSFGTPAPFAGLIDALGAQCVPLNHCHGSYTAPEATTDPAIHRSRHDSDPSVPVSPSTSPDSNPVAAVVATVDSPGEASPIEPASAQVEETTAPASFQQCRTTQGHPLPSRSPAQAACPIPIPAAACARPLTPNRRGVAPPSRGRSWRQRYLQVIDQGLSKSPATGSSERDPVVEFYNQLRTGESFPEYLCHFEMAARMVRERPPKNSENAVKSSKGQQRDVCAFGARRSPAKSAGSSGRSKNSTDRSSGSGTSSSSSIGAPGVVESKEGSSDREIRVWFMLTTCKVYVLESREEGVQSVSGGQRHVSTRAGVPLKVWVESPFDRIQRVVFGLFLQYFWLDIRQPQQQEEEQEELSVADGSLVATVLFMSRSKSLTSQVVRSLAIAFERGQGKALTIENEDLAVLARLQAEVFQQQGASEQEQEPQDVRVFIPLFLRSQQQEEQQKHESGGENNMEKEAHLPHTLIVTQRSLFLVKDAFLRETEQGDKGSKRKDEGKRRFQVVKSRSVADLSSVKADEAKAAAVSGVWGRDGRSGHLTITFGRKRIFSRDFVAEYEEWRLFCCDHDSIQRFKTVVMQ